MRKEIIFLSKSLTEKEFGGLGLNGKRASS